MDQTHTLSRFKPLSLTNLNLDDLESHKWAMTQDKKNVFASSSWKDYKLSCQNCYPSL